MTPQEQSMIQGLIDRVRETQLPDKDPDAEHLLQSTLGPNPDALYILAQTVLVQKYALDQAQKQLSDLKSQLDQARQGQTQTHHTSFLGSLLGHNDPAPPPPPPQSSQPQYAPVPNYQAQPGYAPPPPQYGSPQYGSPQPGSAQSGGFGAPQGGGGGGFLRSALQTATGVAAGALAFQGVESLMHGFGGGGGGFGGGQGFGGFGGGEAPREEVVNNYYGDSGRDRGDLSPDIEDRRADNFGDPSDTSDTSSDRFATDTSSDDTGSDYGNNDDSSLSAGDDSSSFDSGGDSGGDDSSFDSGGDDSSSFS